MKGLASSVPSESVIAGSLGLSWSSGREGRWLTWDSRLCTCFFTWRLWFALLLQVKAVWVRGARQGNCHPEQSGGGLTEPHLHYLCGLCSSLLPSPSVVPLSLHLPSGTGMLGPLGTLGVISQPQRIVLTFPPCQGESVTLASQQLEQRLVLYKSGIWSPGSWLWQESSSDSTQWSWGSCLVCLSTLFLPHSYHLPNSESLKYF